MRLVTTGWETGSLSEIVSTPMLGSNGTLAVVTSNPTPRTGTYCLKAAVTSGVGAEIAELSIDCTATVTEVWVRWAAFFPSGVSPSGTPIIFRCFDTSGGEQMRLRMSPTGIVGLYTPSNTLQAASVVPVQFGQWAVFQVRYQILSTTSSVVEVWLNGTQVINFSGDSVATANLNVRTIRLGIAEADTTVNWTHAIDDLAINDTSGTVNNGKPEDGRVLLLRPNGAGSSTQLARGGTDSGANWSQVDEVPPNDDTDYVYSATNGDRDLYTAENLPGSASAIAVVEAIAYARNSDGGTGSIGLTVKSGATTSESSAKPLTATYQFVRERWETDPNTGSAWTPTAVNAAEVGVTVR